MNFQLIGLIFISTLTLVVMGVPFYFALRTMKINEEYRAEKKARKKEKKRLKKLAKANANSQSESPSASIYPSNPQ